MRSRHLALLLTLLGVVLPAASAAAKPAGGLAVIGIGGGVSAVTRDLDQAKASGATLVRTELSWSSIEPVRAGQRDPAVLAVLDATMRAAQQRRLKVVLLVQSTPCWTSTAPASLRDTCAPGVSSYPPADYAAYANLMAFVAARYQSVLAGVEVWNEPDQSNERYWAGPDKVARYVALAKATYPVVKAAAPRVPVLAGAFVGTSGKWLTALYQAGIKGSYDGLSVHFYTLPLYGLRTTRAVQRRFGDAKPLWLLEAGWNSCRPLQRGREGQLCTTQRYQATNLRQLFAQTRRTSYLKAIVIYKLRDEGADRFGILNAAGKRKPSFAALRSAFVRRQTIRRVTLRLRKSGGVLQAVGSGPEGDLYELRVRQNGLVRYRASFLLGASNGYSVKLPPELGTKGLTVSVDSLWSPTRRATARA